MELETNLETLEADLIIIGGSIGGCSAAYAALQMGLSVIMTEETKWIGGQLTNQGVPPDEHPWMEQFGCTKGYRTFRNKVKSYYFNHYPVKPSISHADFDPGDAIVSKICHEPRVALQVLHEMLALYQSNGQLRIFHEHIPLSSNVKDDYVHSVTVQGKRDNYEYQLEGNYVLDATEDGALLPLTGTEYVTGAESKHETGESHAVEGEAEPNNMQAFTQCFAIDYREGENHVIEKPEQYEFWREYQADFWPTKQLSWNGLVPHTLEPIEYTFFEKPGRFSLWKYRRVLKKSNFEDGALRSDITLVNWPQNDYWLGSVIDVSQEEREKHLYNAKQLSLSLLYWMQTEAPRDDGGKGYPGIRLRKDVMGTEDGIAMYPYIRESRRIIAEFTVKEQHVSAEIEGKTFSDTFYDSVGVGCYRIDLHPSTGLNTYIDFSAYPFQIPLGALIPVKMNNLLPASKNIGTTHITNGCYRLHPVEWNIGEAVGYLTAYCIKNRVKPRDVRNQENLLKDFQSLLQEQGVELSWPNITSV